MKKSFLFIVLMSFSWTISALHEEIYGVQVTLKEVETMNVDTKVAVLTVANYSRDYVHVSPQRIANAVDASALKLNYINNRFDAYAQIVPLSDLLFYSLTYYCVNSFTKNTFVEYPAKGSLLIHFLLRLGYNIQTARFVLSQYNLGDVLQRLETIAPQQTRSFLVPLNKYKYIEDYSIILEKVVADYGTIIQLIID